MEMLDHKISWKILRIFTQECSYDDLVLILNFFIRHGQICFLGFFLPTLSCDVLYEKISWLV